MADRPYMQDLAADIVQRAREALEAGRLDAFRQCLDELENHRRRGPELAAELRSRQRSRHGAAAVIDTSDLRDFRFLTDGRLAAERERAIRSANASIWLSTYSLTDEGSLTTLLLSKASEGVSVRLIVSTRPAKSVTGIIEALQSHSGRIEVSIETNHSKCLVVDDELVIIGSANLTKVWRDAAVTVRSRDLAAAIQEYLGEIAAPNH